jgi:hypothetical protein
VLAIASAFWPILLAVVLVSLAAEHPSRMLAAFLVGGLATCVAVGVLIVLLLQGGDVVDGSNPPADPVVYLGAGALAFIVAAVVQRRPARAAPEPRPASKETFYMRMLRGNVLFAFVAGVALNILPGVFPLVALKDVAQLNEGVALTATILLVFYVIMFALVEVPLVGFMFARERTARDTERLNSWLGANKRRVAVIVLNVLGAYLVARGIITLVT